MTGSGDSSCTGARESGRARRSDGLAVDQVERKTPHRSGNSLMTCAWAKSFPASGEQAERETADPLGPAPLSNEPVLQSDKRQSATNRARSARRGEMAPASVEKLRFITGARGRRPCFYRTDAPRGPASGHYARRKRCPADPSAGPALGHCCCSIKQPARKINRVTY